MIFSFLSRISVGGYLALCYYGMLLHSIFAILYPIYYIRKIKLDNFIIFVLKSIIGFTSIWLSNQFAVFAIAFLFFAFVIINGLYKLSEFID